MVFLCLSSVHILGVLGAGWGSNNTFAVMGAARGVRLVLSYEIPLVTALLFFWGSRQNAYISLDNNLIGLRIFFWALGVVILAVSETQRAPFDFIEAERELVSGFNVEYGAWGFVLLFIAEYGAVLFMGQFLVSFLWAIDFLRRTVLGLVVTSLILGARAVYPRLKVALWIKLCWVFFVPGTLLGLSIPLLMACIGSLKRE